MECQLNNRFALSSNKHNWILIDKNKGRNNQNHYFPNLKQLSNFIVDLRAKECWTKCDIALCNNSTTTLSYHSAIDKISKDLELYFKVGTPTIQGK
jgi:hypothetical protein